jgi:2-desacetyl-2-hydroxyethyl bacteriochlorophyllide A dehydrogenase
MTEFIEALVCAEPGRLAVEQVLVPRAEPGQALVRPLRIGLCGTDYHIFEGTHPFLNYPRIMGHELAVEVLEAPDSSPVAPGETCAVNPYISCGRCIACRKGKPNCCVNISVLGVHRDGGMSGLLALPAENLVAASGLNADACSMVEFLAIGAHAVRRGAVTGHDNVLVLGAGPIGLGVAIFARLSGARVAIVDREPERRIAGQAIAEATPLDIERQPEAPREFTGGDGFDVVFDATGRAKSIQSGFGYVGHGGRYVLVSVVREMIAFSDPDFHAREMTLLGSRNATGEDFARVISSMRSGDVPVQRLITHRTTLAGAVTDIPHWAADKSGLVKAVIELPK